MQQDGRLGERLLEILLCGVSTRKYETVIPELADSAAGFTHVTAILSFPGQETGEIMFIFTSSAGDPIIEGPYIDNVRVSP